MKTVALRFSDSFAPAQGTIGAHCDVIEEVGYVWYGKLGLPLSQKAITYIMNNDDPMILLIHSGKGDRYWARVSKVQREVPPTLDAIPEYYRNRAEDFKSWFQIRSITAASKDILAKCRVLSSGALLGTVSRHSMSPYYIIETEVEGDNG